MQRLPLQALVWAITVSSAESDLNSVVAVGQCVVGAGCTAPLL